MVIKKIKFLIIFSIISLFFISACSNSNNNNGSNTVVDNKTAAKVIVSNNTVYALLSDCSLFSWGSNDYGLLGSGNSVASSDKPVYILGNIKDIFTGNDVIFAVSNDNSLFAWGNNNFGQTGTGNNAQFINIPTKINGITGNIKNIYTIAGSVFVLTDEGSIYAWGDNTNGLLGLGVSDATVNLPQKITSINGIIKDLVVNYNNFSVFALTEDNTLYVWGNKQNGQLGIENSNGVTSTPTKVNGITGNIKKIYAGDESTYALTEDSSLYAWGNNQHGQLGLGLDNVIVNTPTKINGITGTIKEVIVYNRPYNNTQYNYNHVYVITEDSSLYLWGNNEKGQLGLGQEKPIINTPTKIDTLGAVKNVYAGLDATFILTADNSLYASGATHFGQLGLGDLGGVSMIYAFQKVTGYTGNITKFYSRNTCTYALTDDNSVYDWGSNSYGELGLGDDIDRNIPTKVNGLTGVIKDIYTNGSQVFLLMEDDSIYSWGDNIYILGRDGLNNEPHEILFTK